MHVLAHTRHQGVVLVEKGVQRQTSQDKESGVTRLFKNTLLFKHLKAFTLVQASILKKKNIDQKKEISNLVFIILIKVLGYIWVLKFDLRKTHGKISASIKYFSQRQ